MADTSFSIMLKTQESLKRHQNMEEVKEDQNKQDQQEDKEEQECDKQEKEQEKAKDQLEDEEQQVQQPELQEQQLAENEKQLEENEKEQDQHGEEKSPLTWEARNESCSASHLSPTLNSHLYLQSHKGNISSLDLKATDEKKNNTFDLDKDEKDGLESAKMDEEILMIGDSKGTTNDILSNSLSKSGATNIDFTQMNESHLAVSNSTEEYDSHFQVDDASLSRDSFTLPFRLSQGDQAIDLESPPMGPLDRSRLSPKELINTSNYSDHSYIPDSRLSINHLDIDESSIASKTPPFSEQEDDFENVSHDAEEDSNMYSSKKTLVSRFNPYAQQITNGDMSPIITKAKTLPYSFPPSSLQQTTPSQVPAIDPVYPTFNALPIASTAPNAIDLLASHQTIPNHNQNLYSTLPDTLSQGAQTRPIAFPPSGFVAQSAFHSAAGSSESFATDYHNPIPSTDDQQSSYSHSHHPIQNPPNPHYPTSHYNWSPEQNQQYATAPADDRVQHLPTPHAVDITSSSSQSNTHPINVVHESHNQVHRKCSWIIIKLNEETHRDVANAIILQAGFVGIHEISWVPKLKAFIFLSDCGPARTQRIIERDGVTYYLKPLPQIEWTKNCTRELQNHAHQQLAVVSMNGQDVLVYYAHNRVSIKVPNLPDLLKHNQHFLGKFPDGYEIASGDYDLPSTNIDDYINQVLGDYRASWSIVNIFLHENRLRILFANEAAKYYHEQMGL
eukprot:TRINITY_DN5892_c0_g1_i1.p1 TRINITY_DN5892_c0_g1~~TRINITY_DN5892_c0_g1_i1.p1  ORF type:complete len:729 (+),score=148.36 TRINITY_DN5892_c0_g1_i1:171-2357(+)